jgi:hypothetical protein
MNNGNENKNKNKNENGAIAGCAAVCFLSYPRKSVQNLLYPRSKP